MPLAAKNHGDFHSAVVSAGFYAKKRNLTMYVYSGNSYMTQLWRVTPTPAEYLDPINNTGSRVVSVTPDLTVSYHDRH
jgi:hypothetical protein